MKFILGQTLLALLVSVAEASPVEKVVTLLQGLASDLVKDEKTEQAVYDKYACWCETTTARKAQAIDDGKKEMQRLGQEILKYKGTVAVRISEVAELKTQIAENRESQEQSTGLRSKENAAWQSESQETKQALASISTAIDVLAKATKPALLQQDMTAKVQSTVFAAIDTMPTKALSAISTAKLMKLRTAVQAHGKYAPQSATITGILSDMYTTMGADLQDSTALEGSRNRNFEAYIATKDKQLAQLNQISARKHGEQVEAETMLADSTGAYDDVSKQLNSDVEFFGVTKKACEQKTADWQTRSTLRTEEIKGVNDALTILTSDDAKELFAKSIKPGMEKSSLLELDASVAPQKVAKAPQQSKQAGLDKLYNNLKAKAMSSHSLKLATLAADVRMAKTGHFDQVLKSIDALIGVLATEQESDTKKRDQCKEQYQDISQESAKLDWKLKNNDAKIEKLQSLIDKRDAEKTATVIEIADTKQVITDMNSERKNENSAFVQAKKDDLSAIQLLDQAKQTLTEFYKKNNVKVLLQEKADPMTDPDKAPDASFSGKGQRKNQSKGIVAIMTMLIEDLQAEVKNEVKAEESAQLSFEESVASAEKLLKDLTGRKVRLDGVIADRKGEKTEEGDDKTSNEASLADQTKEKKDIQKDCDFMTEKYSDRRKSRDAEMEALRDAKEFLSGLN